MMEFASVAASNRARTIHHPLRQSLCADAGDVSGSVARPCYRKPAERNVESGAARRRDGNAEEDLYSESDDPKRSRPGPW